MPLSPISITKSLSGLSVSITTPVVIISYNLEKNLLSKYISFLTIIEKNMEKRINIKKIDKKM